ncbi:neuronal acetylcholine receptor subunit alpha-6-like [Patiria miniata]|uniref:Uncharacterized protein n=1 Tax=Patiria miniata TaxID=46514 RepID=A0A914A6S0_PATMI|nr:neuronal acetylcholine receptor subunit alpha-6-like [Patiria miniata]
MAGRVNAVAAGALLLMVTWMGIGWIAGCEGSDSAYSLYEDMMKDYNPMIIPVENSSSVMNVYVGLTLSQIVDIDEQNQIMITSIWLKQKWKDYRFVWNPDDYEGLQQMEVPIDQLWKPDVVLYNTADGNYAVEVVNRATVKHDGTVYWNPPVIFRSSCLIDISYFPFDEQRCTMKFGSWTYDASQLDIKPLSRRVERENYRANGEWEIVESLIEKHAIRYACCEDVYLDLTYTFVLHRNPLFYIITLVLPCILIALLTALIFYLPSEAQEKITLCISVLLALIVFLLLIPSIIPPTATTVPLIARYMLFTMATVAISIVATVWTINLHFRNTSTHVMSKWMRRIFLEILPRLLLMKRPGEDKEREEKEKQKQMEKAVIRSNASSSFICLPGDNGRKEPRGYSKTAGASTSMPPSLREEIEHRERGSPLKRYGEYKPVKKEWQELLGYLNYIQHNIEETDTVEDSEDEWAFVGLVIDRFLLVVFTFTVVIGTVVFFMECPIFWENPNTHYREVYEEPEILLSAGYYDLYPTLAPTQPSVSVAR